MNWLAWIVLAVLAAAVMVWLARRFRTEGRRIDGIMRDFDREPPVRSTDPVACAKARRNPTAPIIGVLETAQVTGYPDTQLP